jgi:hypothetical protein
MGANTYREMAAMGGPGSAVPTYVLGNDGTLATSRNTHLYSRSAASFRPASCCWTIN